VLGKCAVPLLIASGHEVTGVARSEQKVSQLESVGAQPARVSDIFDADAMHAAATGCDVYLNLATCIPSLESAWKSSAWRENDRIRSEGSAIAAGIARDLGMKVLIQESIVMNYPDCGDQWIDETQPIKVTRRTASGEVAERNALAVASDTLRSVVLRFGLFDAPEGSHGQGMARFASKGFAALSGRPGGFISGVKIEDAATAVVASLDIPTGIYNVTGDNPKRRSEIAAQLAVAAGRKRLVMFPGRAALLLGDKNVGAVARSQRVSNAKFKSATGWSPS